MRRELPSFVRVVFGGLALGIIVTVVLVGCGARGPLDADGLATNLTPPPDSGPDATVEAEPDAAAPPDAGPIQTAIACGGCVVQSCGKNILSCLQSEGCRNTLQCVATTCLAGGGSPDPICLLKCGSSDPSGAVSVLGLFQCITGTCGDDCASVLGQLGNLGDLGGRP